MTTYKITGNTNGYIASRDIHFNGKTEIEIATGLTHEEARKKLENYFCDDYQNYSLGYCSNEDEFLMALFGNLISDMAYSANVSETEYFNSHKKSIEILNSKNTRFNKFEGAGWYAFNSNNTINQILLDTDNSYEYDSRYYSITEEGGGK